MWWCMWGPRACGCAVSRSCSTTLPAPSQQDRLVASDVTTSLSLHEAPSALLGQVQRELLWEAEGGLWALGGLSLPYCSWLCVSSKRCPSPVLSAIGAALRVCSPVDIAGRRSPRCLLWEQSSPPATRCGPQAPQGSGPKLGVVAGSHSVEWVERRTRLAERRGRDRAARLKHHLATPGGPRPLAGEMSPQLSEPQPTPAPSSRAPSGVNCYLGGWKPLQGGVPGQPGLRLSHQPSRLPFHMAPGKNIPVATVREVRGKHTLTPEPSNKHLLAFRHSPALTHWPPRTRTSP